MRGRSLAPLMMGTQPVNARPIYAEMAGETDPGATPTGSRRGRICTAIKDDGYKLIHQQQSDPAGNELFAVEAETIFERENVAGPEPERAAAMWDGLQKQFSIPTEFLFLPFVERP